MKLIENGDVIRVANVTGTPEKLKAGNYLLKVDQSGYYLQKKANFALPKKVYGDHSEVDRWLKSYQHNSEKNLGIILSGMKGTGKTITAQMLCKKAQKPVIIINEPFFGSDFIDFVTSPLFKDSIIFVDEYEKIYQKYQDGKNPHDFLQIMDGNYNTRLMFLLTVNEMSINEYLVNRPGRIKYRKSFDNLPSDVLDEVIDDLLENKEHKPSVIGFFERLGMITFDLAVCLIKDMNLFKEDAYTVAKYLNLKAEAVHYNVAEVRDGKTFPCEDIVYHLGLQTFRIDRLTYFQGTKEKDWEDAEEGSIYVDSRTADIKKVGLDYVTIVTPEKHTFRLTRKPKYYYAI
jgi:SpoVK/Ycf46/Vps4 family AAA+-type ATPase